MEAASLPRLLAGLRDLAFPPGCLGCGRVVGQDQAFCPACAGQVAWLQAACPVCGQPQAAGGADCPSCAVAAPAWDRAWALAGHAGPVAEAVRAFKYRRAWAIGAGLGRLLAQRVPPDLLAGVDIIAPVPLHRWRLLRRGFNQAQVLARELSRRTSQGEPRPRLLPDLLLRRRHTRPQVGMSPAQRAANVAGAFAVHPRRAALPAGRRVLLVDDVLTTGATVGECARALRAAGAAWVGVVTVSRGGAIRPGRET